MSEFDNEFSTGIELSGTGGAHTQLNQFTIVDSWTAVISILLSGIGVPN